MSQAPSVKTTPCARKSTGSLPGKKTLVRVPSAKSAMQVLATSLEKGHLEEKGNTANRSILDADLYRFSKDSRFLKRVFNCYRSAQTCNWGDVAKRVSEIVYLDRITEFRYHAHQKMGPARFNVFHCPACNDSFLFEESLEQHLNRRTLLLSVRVGDDRWQFYNQCAAKIFAVKGVEKQYADKYTLEAFKAVGMMDMMERQLESAESASSDQPTDSTEPSHDLTCARCEKHFASEKEFGLHLNESTALHVSGVVAQRSQFVNGVNHGLKACFICKRIFHNDCALNLHVRVLHLGKMVLICPDCGFRCQGGASEFDSHLKYSCLHPFYKGLRLPCCLKEIHFNEQAESSVAEIASHMFACATTSIEQQKTICRNRGLPLLKSTFQCRLCSEVMPLNLNDVLNHLLEHCNALKKEGRLFVCPVCPFSSADKTEFHATPPYYSLSELRLHAYEKHRSLTRKAAKFFLGQGLYLRNVLVPKWVGPRAQCLHCYDEFESRAAFRKHLSEVVSKSRCWSCFYKGEAHSGREVLEREHPNSQGLMCVSCWNTPFRDEGHMASHFREFHSNRASVDQFLSDMLALKVKVASNALVVDHLPEEERLPDGVDMSDSELESSEMRKEEDPEVIDLTALDSDESQQAEKHVSVMPNAADAVSCSLCKLVCDDFLALEEHLETIHYRPGSYYICWICKENSTTVLFTRKKDLANHICRVHKVPYSQIDYSRMNDPKGLYIENMEKQERMCLPPPKKRLRAERDGILDFICMYCSFQSSVQSEFVEHIRTHRQSSGEIQCDECGLCLLNRRVLQMHRFMAHKKKGGQLSV